MSPTASVDQRLAALGKASRRSALVSLLGFFLILCSLGYAATQLAKLERQRSKLEHERASLVSQIEKETTELAKVRNDLASARQAVAASRSAINAFHAGRLEDAVALYDEALQADPDNAYLQNLRAYALFRLHRVDLAIEGQRRSLAVDPQYAWGYFDLARFLCSAQPPKLEEARQAANKALELRPELRGIMERDGEFQRVCAGKIPAPARPANVVRQEIDRIRQGPHSPMPPAHPSDRAQSGPSNLLVQNQTEYVLHVFLDGPDSARLTIPPHDSKTLQLSPGDYDLAAKVSDATVIPFYGKHKQEPHVQYSIQFYKNNPTPQ